MKKSIPLGPSLCAWAVLAGPQPVYLTAAQAQTDSVALTIARQSAPEIHWASQKGFVYRLEFSEAVVPAQWQVLAKDLAGSGNLLTVKDDGFRTNQQRFYRVAQVAAMNTDPAISPTAVLPMPGIIYPGGIVFGSPVLGLQFTIPPTWKGGVRDGTSLLIFGSDTEAGLVLGVIALSGNPETVARALSDSFVTSAAGGFQITQPGVIGGSKITAEWLGYGENAGATLRLEALVHPSGGILGFGGLFLEANRASMQRTLNSFTDSAVLVARKTDTQMVQAIAGHAFTWAAYHSTGNGGSSGSLSSWSQNNAFFCLGTYEITRNSESSYSGNLSDGGFYTGGSSSRSTETGDWTVIQTPTGPLMLMLSEQGVQTAIVSIDPSGRSIYFGDQQFDGAGLHNCP
jgi:hypothetical protein